MKLLLCHEFYRQFGGEDQSFLDEASMLRSNGHEIFEYRRSYEDIERIGRIGTATRSVWNFAVYRELRAIIRRERPNIMHCTNLFPLISPAAYKAAHDENVPIVQALRNYRLICPSATLARDGKICEDCLGKILPWPAVRHGCYQGSRLGSAVVATTFGIHNLKGTWRRVDCFYTPSHFARSVFIRAGFPAEKIEVKPNSVVPDPGIGSGDGGYVLFVGRLSPEKGIGTLLKAWAELEEDLPLHIIGDGVCSGLVEQAAARDERIVFLGERSHQQVLEEMRAATCLVMASELYETFGRTIVEAYAAGTPVIASRMGSMQELLAHEETGLLFEAGSASALAKAISKLCYRSDLHELRRRARREFEDKYSTEQSYRCLMNIYERAINRHREASRAEDPRPPRFQERPVSVRKSPPSSLETRPFGSSLPAELKTAASELPLTNVYVTTYNGKRFLETCFRTLEQLTDYPNHKLILADNGSSDDSGKYVRDKFPMVDVLRIFPNFGWAHGANAAIRDARRRGAKYIALLNDDIEVLHPEWLSEAVAHAERDSSIGIISFVEAIPDGGCSDVPQCSIIDVEYLGSCALFMPVALFDRIGMFDELYYHIGDEDDLGARTQAAGYRTVKLNVPILHLGAGADQEYGLRTAYLQMRNGIRFCLKHRTLTHAVLRSLRIIDVACNPWSVTFDHRNVAHRRMRNSGNVFINMLLWLKAISWNIVRFPQTLSIRAAERRLSCAARVKRNSVA
jgi:glycosyltransferase involved in cell wall biosynthesis/GT2 family glycosyltransferase